MAERNILFSKLLGEEKISKIQSAIVGPSGKMGQGVVPSMKWMNERFGEFGERILMVPSKYQRIKERDSFTTIGGICAVRTADVNLLQNEGKIDPVDQYWLTREGLTVARRKEVTGVDQFADYLRMAIGIDQIIEAIGVSRGNKYVAISEERLWSERMSAILEERLKRELTGPEKTKIRGAVKEAEEKRFRYIRNYINLVRGSSDTDLTPVIDEDVFGDLVEVRRQMMDIAGISLEKLASTFNEDTKTLDGLSIVWGMYIGPYITMLKKKGYISTQMSLIVEPWMHAAAERQSKDYLDEKLFTGKNEYLQPGGLNENVGLIPYMGISLPNGKRARQAKTISEVPNSTNYRNFLDFLWSDFSMSSGTSLNLSENPVFIWGVNLFPYGSVRSALLKMVDLQIAYKQEKVGVTSSGDSDIQGKQRKVAELKSNFESLMIPNVEQVVRGLKEMFDYTFGTEQI